MPLLIKTYNFMSSLLNQLSAETDNFSYEKNYPKYLAHLSKRPISVLATLENFIITNKYYSKFVFKAIINN